MTVFTNDIMTKSVVTCSPNEPLLSVVKNLATNKFSCIVVTEANTPVGIITERDLVEVLVETLEGTTWDELSIKNFMTSPIITVSEDLAAEEAILISSTSRIRHIPVVNQSNNLVGILTQTNFVDAYYNHGGNLA